MIPLNAAGATRLLQQTLVVPAAVLLVAVLAAPAAAGSPGSNGGPASTAASNADSPGNPGSNGGAASTAASNADSPGNSGSNGGPASTAASKSDSAGSSGASGDPASTATSKAQSAEPRGSSSDEAPRATAKAGPAKAREPKVGGVSSEAVTEDNDTGDSFPNCPQTPPDPSRHPSGKDRYCEPQRAGNQGGAKSDPDDDGRGPDRSNGGVDQPGGPGGAYDWDQDGNNGCGNDQDFEDDNEGRCLGRRKRLGGQAPGGSVDQRRPAPVRTEENSDAEGSEGGAVGGITTERNNAPTVARETPAKDDNEVLGVTIERRPDVPDVQDVLHARGPAVLTAVTAASAADVARVPAMLARTGFSASHALAVALGLVAYGVAALGLTRRRRT